MTGGAAAARINGDRLRTGCPQVFELKGKDVYSIRKRAKAVALQDLINECLHILEHTPWGDWSFQQLTLNVIPSMCRVVLIDVAALVRAVPPRAMAVGVRGQTIAEYAEKVTRTVSDMIIGGNRKKVVLVLCFENRTFVTPAKEIQHDFRGAVVSKEGAPIAGNLLLTDVTPRLAQFQTDRKTSDTIAVRWLQWLLENPETLGGRVSEVCGQLVGIYTSQITKL
jgi:hypothetical protein